MQITYKEDPTDLERANRMRARVEVLASSPALVKLESGAQEGEARVKITAVEESSRLRFDLGDEDGDSQPLPPFRSQSSSSVSSAPVLPPMVPPQPRQVSPKIRTKVPPQPKRLDKKRAAPSAFGDWPDSTLVLRGGKARGTEAAAAAAAASSSKSAAASQSRKHTVVSCKSGRNHVSGSEDEELVPASKAFSQSAVALRPKSLAANVGRVAADDPVEEEAEAPSTPDRRPAGITTGSSDKGRHASYRPDASKQTGLLALLHVARNGLKQSLVDLVNAPADALAGQSPESLCATLLGGATRDELHYAVAAQLDSGRQVTLLIRCEFDETRAAKLLKRLNHVGFFKDPRDYLADMRFVVHAPFHIVDDVVICGGLVRVAP